MATTAVFAEIVVVGLQVQALLVLLVLAIFGTEWISLSALADWTALLTILTLAGAYMLGVVVDRIADNVWRSAHRYAERRNWRTGPRAI